LFTPTIDMPCSRALVIAICVARNIATMPLLLPPSRSADVGVSRTARMRRRGSRSRRCSATLRIFGRPEYS
jgi:hypothetical protein